MSWYIYLISFIFITAGIFHFIKPKTFLKIMPPYIPLAKEMVIISGVAEIIVGIAVLFDSYRTPALWGIFAMLITFLPVHIHMLIDKHSGFNLPKSLLIGRLVLQFVSIYLIYNII